MRRTLICATAAFALLAAPPVFAAAKGLSIVSQDAPPPVSQ